MADHLTTGTVWWKDALERVLWTFVEAFFGALLLDGIATGISLGLAEKAALAGLVAAFAVVKTVAASRLGRSPDAAIPTLSA